MAFSYGDYNDELDHTLKAEGENTDSLFLFANNNTGTAENLGNYRLYDMKIEGDSQGVTEGVDYVDCLIGDGASYIDSGIVVQNGYTVDLTFKTMLSTTNDRIVLCGSGDMYNYTYDRFGGYAIGLFGYNIAVKEIRDINSNDKNALISTNTKFIANTKTIYSYTFTNVTNQGSCIIMGQNFSDNTNPSSINYICPNTISIYDFKIYNTEGTLLIHLRPCLDTSKVPCMYDEVTKRYFYNQGTGTFGYKKKLRDFQPVLDKNNVPCLMDKINRKYYYAKNGKTFNCREQIGYRGVSYLQGDYNSYIDTGLRANEMHGYTIEIQYKRVTDYSRGNQLVFGSSKGGFDSSEVNCHLRYDYYGYPQGLSCSDEVSNAIYNPSVSTIINATFTINTPSSTGSFYLFAGNNNDSPIGTCDATIYYWKIYDTNSNLVQHLVPALDSNNVPCMYDKVSQQFFYNQGEGEFSCGIEELECPPVNYVEYIDNKGKSYFDTGVSAGETGVWGIKYKISYNSLYDWYNDPIGESDNKFYLPSPQDMYGRNSMLCRLGSSERVYSFNITWTPNTVYEVEYNTANVGLYLNGVATTSTVYEDSTSGRGNFVLFKNNQGLDITSAKIYYVQLYLNYELYAEFKPCLDINGIPCFYETLTKKYIYNSTSNNVEYGDILGYTPISYIESNGTQYIDTGVVPNDNTDIDMVCRSTNVTPYIKDGLILNLDGINNTMISHNSSTTVWEDLSGNGLNFNLNNITINDDSMSFNGTTSYANIQDIELWKTIANNTTEYDVELCFKFNNSESYQPIISSNYGLINVAKFVKYLQFKSTNFGLNLSSILGSDDWSRYGKFTVSCNMNALLGYFNTTNYTLESTNNIAPPTSDNFSIGTRLTGDSYWFCGDIYSIRIYNRHLTDEERLYNHSVDVKRFDVTTDVMTINTDNYIMNGLATDNTYKYNATDTTVEPNLTASTGATLTLRATNLAYLTEEEIEQATNDGWTLE